MKLIRIHNAFHSAEHFIGFEAKFYTDPINRRLFFRTTWQLIGAPMEHVDVRATSCLREREDALTHSFAMRFIRSKELFDVSQQMRDAMGEVTGEAVAPFPIRGYTHRNGTGEE